MLNAHYNLPSEDCNTEKQMVFHSNKLLCVYSLQSWLSDAFTFGSELPCRQQPGDGVLGGVVGGGGAGSLGRGFLTPRRPSPPPPLTPGFSCGSDRITGKCSAPDAAQARLGAGCMYAARPRSWWQLAGCIRSLAECDSLRPHALQTSQVLLEQAAGCSGGRVVACCGCPAGERLRAGVLELGGSGPWPDCPWPAG